MRTLFGVSIFLATLLVGCSTAMDPQVVSALSQRIQHLEDQGKEMKMSSTPKEKIPAENFVQTVSANVDNDKLTDEAFREFIRNTLPIVDVPTINKDVKVKR